MKKIISFLSVAVLLVGMATFAGCAEKKTDVSTQKPCAKACPPCCPLANKACPKAKHGHKEMKMTCPTDQKAK
ncbi:MAG: hypothetical protein WC975_03465 [Phycisphaerae bacterium]